MERLPAELGKGILVFGDSELIIGFCTRKYRPSKKFFRQVLSIKRISYKFRVPMAFRHVYCTHNSDSLANWLANIACHLVAHADLTSTITTYYPNLDAFAPPTFPASTIPLRITPTGIIGGELQPTVGG
jgi:hypothetical protein